MARRFRSAPCRLSHPFVERSGGGRMNEMLDGARIADAEALRSAPPTPRAGTADIGGGAQGGAAPFEPGGMPPSSEASPLKGGEGADRGERQSQRLAQRAPEEGRGGAHRAGMRLQRCEFFNWGTFHARVWGLDLNADNALLTGDIGSGKSTLVDAITTLLVPAQKISYNKAAGADTRERDLKSYVLGHYKSERGDSGFAAKPVALRGLNTYSVILGRFRNGAFQQDVTLAQVFWFKEAHGQPTRFYIVADAPLAIAEHFSDFGSDANALKKRLRSLPRVEVHDTFPPYSASFRRRFGIENEQALDLFHQTVSMKSVGNLTDFVRQHMLETFPVEARIDALMAHFDNLNRAHASVLTAKTQIERLQPLVADCDLYAGLADEIEDLRGCREALRAFFASVKAGLLGEHLQVLELDAGRVAQRIGALRE